MINLAMEVTLFKTDPSADGEVLERAGVSQSSPDSICILVKATKPV